MVPVAIAMIDFVNALRSKRRFVRHSPQEEKNNKLLSIDRVFVKDQFSILVPIFGHISYLKNLDFLQQYGHRVILCTTTHETAEFYSSLEIVAEKHNFRIFRSSTPLSGAPKTPNPWKLFHLTLRNSGKMTYKNTVRDEIIRDSFREIKSPYCVFLDGDTISEQPLEQLVANFKESQFDVASVRIMASQSQKIIEKMQSIEYKLAMDARRLYPWLTSGACMIAKTRVIQQIMTNHSLFFSGGDIEIGKLASMLRYKVGHIPFVLYTDVPSSFKGWFRQRMAWCGGGFRHTIVNCNKYIWRHPFYFFYFTIVVYGATPLRWYELVHYPLILPFVLCLYWILILLVFWKSFRWYHFLFPIYALLQVMIIVPLGVYTYSKMAHTSKNLGIIKLRNKPIYLSRPRLRPDLVLRKAFLRY